MKMKVIIPAVLITVTAGFTGCQKDTRSNSGNSTLEFQMQAMNRSYSLPVSANGSKSVAVSSAAITWDTARMVVSRLKYEAELKKNISNHDSIKIAYEWNGPQIIDLLDPSTVLGSYTLLPGYYDEIELNVQGLKKDAAGNPVFYLNGMYTNPANTSVPIMFKVYEDVMFKTEKDSVEVTADNSIFTSTILLYLDQLLVGIDPLVLDHATLTNGAIVISANSNAGLYHLIMQNLHKDHHCRHNHKPGYN